MAAMMSFYLFLMNTLLIQEDIFHIYIQNQDTSSYLACTKASKRSLHQLTLMRQHGDSKELRNFYKDVRVGLRYLMSGPDHYSLQNQQYPDLVVGGSRYAPRTGSYSAAGGFEIMVRGTATDASVALSSVRKISVLGLGSKTTFVGWIATLRAPRFEIFGLLQKKHRLRCFDRGG